MFHHGEHARGATARSMFGGAVGVAMAPVQSVEVAGQVRRVDRHAAETRLLQVVNVRRQQQVEPGWGHGGMLPVQEETLTSLLLPRNPIDREEPPREEGTWSAATSYWAA